MTNRREDKLRGLSLEGLCCWSTTQTPHYRARYSGDRDSVFLTPPFATGGSPSVTANQFSSLASTDTNLPPTNSHDTPIKQGANRVAKAAYEDFTAAVQRLSIRDAYQDQNCGEPNAGHTITGLTTDGNRAVESTTPSAFTGHYFFPQSSGVTAHAEIKREKTFPFTFACNMVREQESARNPLAPAQMNTIPTIQTQTSKATAETTSSQPPNSQAVSQTSPTTQISPTAKPVFGQPTALGSPQPFSRVQSLYQPSQNPLGQRQTSGTQPKDKFSNLFVPSKTQQQKQMLHKPHIISNPLMAADRQFNRPLSATQSTSTARPLQKIIDSDDDDSVYEIQPPKQPPAWRPAPAPQPTFSSNTNTNPFYRPKQSNFADLAVGTIGFATNSSMFNQNQSERWEPLSYMDAEKASENIKALLEAAFEDEDDMPNTKTQGKHAGEKLDDLTKQLQGLDVRSETLRNDPNIDQEDDGEELEDESVVEGLKVKLLPHQVQGVRWMCDKELGNKKTKGVLPKGGILADDMGLGKTIQSIALLLKNPRKDLRETQRFESEDKPQPQGGTLVVAPLALIKQWEGEIKDRIDEDHALKVCVHHGPQRAKSYKDLRKYDVVITTYNTLTSEHAGSDDMFAVGCFGLKWYRIILDEAHSIKNRNAKATKAACALHAEYRWCLTGTPMQNNLDELQSLIHFLRIKPYEDLNAWRDQITKPMMSGRGGLAIQRLQVYLKAFMKRRTKEVLKQNLPQSGMERTEQDATKANGFRIVQRTVKKVEATFTPEERQFYKRLESRADQSLEQMMAGNKMSYASALVLLMRLRQACNHPQLTGSDLSKERDTTRGNQTPRKKQSTEDDIDAIANMLGGLTVETKRCDMCLIELSKKDSFGGAIRCRECELDLQEQKNQAGPQSSTLKVNKGAPQRPNHNVRAQNRRIVTDSDDEGDTPRITPNHQRHQNHDTKSDTSDASDNDDEDAYDSSSDDSATQQTIMQSTKIRELLRILHADSHTHKYIVFSFFTSMLDLIEPFLLEKRIRYVRYDGQMRNDAREASLESLRNNPRTRVLLCSLRAGSLGLNLTAASRVVILEPFWNPFVEEQAIDRVHRLNQTQDVVVHKITIKNTVEARILELQEKKRELANATIEGRKDGAGKLTLKDMLKLFRHDAEKTHGVDMIGMRDRTGLLDRGDQTGDDEGFGSHKDSSAILQRSSRGVSPEMAKASKRQEHEVYGRRW